MQEAPLGPEVTEGDLKYVIGVKTAGRTSVGWSPRLRRRFGYYTPSEWYQAVVHRLVGPNTDWLDVGCRRDVFHFNYPLAQKLAARCRHLTGLDPATISMQTILSTRGSSPQSKITDRTAVSI